MATAVDAADGEDGGGPASVDDGLPPRLRRAVGRMGRRLRQTRAGAGLSPSQYEVLVTLVSRGPLRVTELAEAEGLNPTMVSRIVAKLENGHLVQRMPDAEDGRVAHLTATPAAHRLVEDVRNERTDVLSVTLERLDADQRRALVIALPILEELADRLTERLP